MANNTTITDNVADNNGYVGLGTEANCTIINNTMSNNQYGLTLEGSMGGSGGYYTLRNNIMSGNQYNFMAENMGNYNIDSSNLVNGKPILYLVNASNIVVDPSSNVGTVYVINGYNVTVKDLMLSNNGFGVLFYNTSNSLIRNVTVTGDYYGINIMWPDNDTLAGNNAINNSYGIYVNGGEYNNNTLVNNKMTGNAYNYGDVSGSSDNNISTSNTVDGKPIIYLYNESDLVIDSNWDVGDLYVFNGSNITVRDLNLSNNLYGIELINTNNSKLQDNQFYNDQAGLFLISSNQDTVIGNGMQNDDEGIYMDSVNNSIITGNTVSNNMWSGVQIQSSSGNIMTRNSITNNGEGIDSWNAPLNDSGLPDNQIYLNDIANNQWESAQADTNVSWSSITPLTYTFNGISYTGCLGNYWSDYTGVNTNGDGIGDTAYNNNGVVDNYPLVQPNSNYVLEEQALRAGFTVNISSGMAPLTVQFNDTSSGSPQLWQWNFGDGSTNQTTQNVSYTFPSPGTYTVTLTVINGAESSTVSHTIIVTSGAGQLAADFTENVTSGNAPLTVMFNDTSSGSPTSWQWNFGDGSTNGTTQNVMHTYSTAGTFTVTLTVGNGNTSSTLQYAGLITVMAPELYLSDSAPSSVYQGATLNYTLYYGNLGNVGAGQAVLQDVLPAGVTFISATNGGLYDASNNTVTWNIGMLDAFEAGSWCGGCGVEVEISNGAAVGTVLQNIASVTAVGCSASAMASTGVAQSVLPMDVGMTQVNGNSGGTPSLYYNSSETFTYNGDSNVTGVNITIHMNSGSFPDINTSMNGSYPTWTYTLTFYPRHGSSTITYNVHYNNSSSSNTTFKIYVDPAGYIYDTVNGSRIANATVWLQEPDGNGGWMDVPAGQAIMQPDTNPLTTDSSGGFQWDTLNGTYRIHVEAPGYYPADSIIVNVPPPVYDLEIGLTPIPSSYTILLNTGWNLVSTPILNSSLWAGNVSATGVDKVAYYSGSSQLFSTFLVGLSHANKNFPLVPDTGYFVNCTNSSMDLTVNGTLVDSPRTLDLYPGWNLVGWSSSNNMTAQDFGGLSGNITKIAGYNSQTGLYTTYLVGLSHSNRDFNMSRGNGYFVYSNATSMVSVGV